MPSVGNTYNWLFQNAGSITFDCEPVTAQTITRTGVVRTVSRGGQVWKIRLTPSPATWTEARIYISKIKNRLGKAFSFTWYPNSIGPPYAYDSIMGYQGDATNTGSSAFTVTVPAGTSVNTVTVANSTVPGGGYVLRDGDFFSLSADGPKYQVHIDPSTGTSASIACNRPIIEAAGNYNAWVGITGGWRLIPVQIPSYQIVPAGRQQLVEWDGDFLFYEDLTT